MHKFLSTCDDGGEHWVTVDSMTYPLLTIGHEFDILDWADCETVVDWLNDGGYEAIRRLATAGPDMPPRSDGPPPD